MDYREGKEIILFGLGEAPSEIIPEVNLTYSTSENVSLKKIRHSEDVADFLRSLYPEGTIELQEQMIVLYLDNQNKIKGFYRHSKGSITATVADIRIILAGALKSLSVAMILAHNHPSGNLFPSEADNQLTKKISDAAKLMDIRMLDHIIITKESYYSFADNGFTGLGGINFTRVLKKYSDAGRDWEEISWQKAIKDLEESGFWKKDTVKEMLFQGLTLWTSFAQYKLEQPESKQLQFSARIHEDLRSGVKHTKTLVEKLAATYDITDKTEVKELTELAIVRLARILANTTNGLDEKFEAVVRLYNNQVTLSHRTSMSIMLQQYSTPAPIAYLAGLFAGMDKEGNIPETISVFEPSAGNGLLTIAFNPDNVVVNEIDEMRRANLEVQGYKEVLKQDATVPFPDFAKKFDVVITNPPFGILEKEVRIEGFPIKALDQLMAIRALETMKDNGRASIIIGSHTTWDDKDRITAGKNLVFFNYLYSRFHVIDVINIDGKKLYSRQGTAFDVRLILISGRKATPQGAAPLRDKRKDVVVSTFEDLYERVMDSWATAVENVHLRDVKESDLELLALAIELELDNLGLSGVRKDKQPYEMTFEEYLKKMLLVCHKEINPWRRKQLQTMHKELVTLALFQRKAIPVKVLKEYPDLKTHSFAEQKRLEREALELEKKLREEDELGAPYQPASDSCVVLNTVVPDAMEFETHSALQRIKEDVGGDLDEYVRRKLNYPSKTELCKSLSAEQIDAVGMGIYNIEFLGQGMIIGDQTGIGKGRVAAAMIRYASTLGLQPIFITEKPNLFSDIYRDLAAIGSGHLVPFIVNGKEPKTDIKDEDGNVIYQALPSTEQNRIFENKTLPKNFDFIVGTYSQFSSPKDKPLKPSFLLAMAAENILIMDESHNASGSSNTGEFFQEVLRSTIGVIFLSATFAKRPDNMPVYAMKTAISDANMSKTELVEAIMKGGVALQEVLASQLVAEGQMLRRERSFEGVEVNYISLDEKEEEHKAIADSITSLLREIISFQSNHINDMVEDLDDIAKAEGKIVDMRAGTEKIGVDNIPYFSKVFNVINQMLFSIKAESVAERAIQRLREGKKPVIAFASTMGSFIEEMENDKGLPVSDGDIINADFSEVLQKGLEGIFRYTETLPNGEKAYKKFNISELSPEAQHEYLKLSERIKSISTGITISPIDVIVRKIKEAGYSVAEVTGRKYQLQINPKTNQAMVSTRKKVNTNDAFREFNNNEVDVLLINQAGSTGASAHAIVTPKVPKEQVKKRVMIVLQAELDINTEVQKRGRINRTGQIFKPIYDYVISAIPAEKRLMMMLQKKLKSLDANTTSNQKQSTKILDVPDFLNKYGDRIVAEYLKENPKVNDLLDDPLNMKKDSSEDGEIQFKEDAAHKVSGRVAVLSTQMQQDFYNEISSRYNDYVEYLKQTGEYDLEVETMNLQAETIKSEIVKVGKGGASTFGEDSFLETVRANVLKKPFSRKELEVLLKEALGDKSAEDLQQETLKEYQHFVSGKLEEELRSNHEYYQKLITDISNEKKAQRILEKQGEEAFRAFIQERMQELEVARDKSAEKIESSFSNRKHYMEGIFSFFYPGRNLSFPVKSLTEGQVNVPAVFIGFQIDRKKPNPYAPSALKLRIAIANSNKYITIPASWNDEVNSIKGASYDLRKLDMESLLNQWEETIKKSTTDRNIRYIVTGNLLQAFSEFKGKLVSYTTLDGSVKKGILMPEYWTVDEDMDKKVVVPISKAVKIIRSLGIGSQITTNDDVSIFRQPDYFKIIVTASRQRGGEFYLDKDILELVRNNRFEKISNKMAAILPIDQIDRFVEILQSKFNQNVSLSPFQFDMIRDELPVRKPKERIMLKPVMKLPETSFDELELEALALELELELLDFAA